MKIAIFSTAYLPFVGGAELAVKEITYRLPNRKFLCLTYKFDQSWPNVEKIGNVEVVRVGSIKSYYGQRFKKLFYVFKLWKEAERLHKKEPFVAIWAIMASYAGIAALFFKLRHPKILLLLTLQEGDSEKHILNRVGIFYPVWRLIFKKANYIQAISNYLADFARKHGAKCPIEVVPNGVNLDRINNYELGIKNDKAVIITTSRLVHKNGIDVLIGAAAKLRTLIPNSKFLIQISGFGPDEKKLKDLAKNLSVEDCVKFLGHIEPEKISEYLAKADVFARSSRSEGLGSSFLEAMGAGLPVIGTPVGGIPDFLKDEETGLFAKVDDPEDLAKKIALLLKDENLRKRLGENGRKLVEEKYNWDKIAIKMEILFNKLK